MSALNDKTGEEVAITKQPHNTPFLQQKLPSVQPAFSPFCILSVFFVFGVLFISLGAAILAASDEINSFEFRYDDLQACPWVDREKNSPSYTCDPMDITFTLTKTLKAPTYLYYMVTKFYQNNRAYVRSLSNSQMSGDRATTAELEFCGPYAYVSEQNPTGPTSGSTIVPQFALNETVDLKKQHYNPCGLVAWSAFNDTISLFREVSPSTYVPPSAALVDAANRTWELLCDAFAFDENGNALNQVNMQQCKQQGISWPNIAGVRYDRSILQSDTLTTDGYPGACEKVYNTLHGGSVLTSESSFFVNESTPSLDLLGDNWDLFACNGWYVGERGNSIPSALNEDLWSWARFGSFSTIKKLHRVLISDLRPGVYRFQVRQRWDSSSFDGHKYIVLEQTSWVGSKNFFLGGLLVAVGCILLIVGCAFLAKHWAQPPRLAS